MSFFELECCEMSQFEVTMLQVKVGIVCDKFTVTPNFKDYYLGSSSGFGQLPSSQCPLELAHQRHQRLWKYQFKH